MDFDTWCFRVFIVILTILTIHLGFIGIASACDHYCTTCDLCESNITAASSGETVCLSNNITDYAGTCINNPANFNNKIFDCQGHTIDGTDNSSSFGIWLISNENNTLKNCVVTDFGYGIYLRDSSNNNILTNNTANSNVWHGIYLYTSSINNTLTKNTANGNQYYGFFASSDSTGNVLNTNTFCNNVQAGGAYYDIADSDSNTGDNNTCDTTSGWNDTGTMNCTYGCTTGQGECNTCDECEAKLNDNTNSQVNLMANITDYSGNCISDPENFTSKIFDCRNNKIDGVGTDTGIFSAHATNNTIKNCIITDFGNAFYLFNFSEGNLTNNTANSNAVGVYFEYLSRNNSLTDNNLSDNSIGIQFRDNSNNNSFSGNTASDNEYDGVKIWIDSEDINLTSNILCGNNQDGGSYYDIRDDNTSNIGDDNVCDLTYQWNDTGALNCTFICGWNCTVDSGGYIWDTNGNSTNPIIRFNHTSAVKSNISCDSAPVVNGECNYNASNVDRTIFPINVSGDLTSCSGLEFMLNTTTGEYDILAQIDATRAKSYIPDFIALLISLGITGRVLMKAWERWIS